MADTVVEARLPEALVDVGTERTVSGHLQALVAPGGRKKGWDVRQMLGT